MKWSSKLSVIAYQAGGNFVDGQATKSTARKQTSLCSCNKKLGSIHVNFSEL